MPGLIESEENSNAPTLTNNGGRPSSSDEEDTGTPTFSEQPEHWPYSAGHINAVEEFYNDLENGPDPSQEIRIAFQRFRDSLRSVAGLSDVDRHTLQMSLNGLENTVEGHFARSVNRTMLRQADSAEADGSSSAREEFGEDADRGWQAQFG
jgi:hypothetical protein